MTEIIKGKSEVSKNLAQEFVDDNAFVSQIFEFQDMLESLHAILCSEEDRNKANPNIMHIIAIKEMMLGGAKNLVKSAKFFGRYVDEKLVQYLAEKE